MAALTRMFERVDTHGTAASELFLVLLAVRGVALAVRTVCAFASSRASRGLAAV